MIKVDLSKFNNLEKLNEQAISNVMDKAYRYFVNKTPIRTGNARRNTTLDGETITGDYPYGDRLDKGWSHQSPDGMTQPTINKLPGWINEETRKL
jgi:hypothetical protein